MRAALRLLRYRQCVRTHKRAGCGHFFVGRQTRRESDGHIERGTRKASLETMVSIANALGVSADTLLQDSLDIMTRPVVTDACLSDHSRALLTDIVGVLREHDVGHG